MVSKCVACLTFLRRRIEMESINAFVGLDVHKETIAVAVADAGREGEVRFWGTIPNTAHHVEKLAAKLVERHGQIAVTYEAGPCGYEIYRLLKARGIACDVIAPSQIPRKAGDRIKNDHRDAVTLARLTRAGELTAIWVPDPIHEAIRDLVRARHAATKDLKQARQRIQSFLLKHAASNYPSKPWTGRHRLWLAGPSLPPRSAADRLSKLHHFDGASAVAAHGLGGRDSQPCAPLVARPARRCACKPCVALPW